MKIYTITNIIKKNKQYELEYDANKNIYITEDTIVHFMLSKGKTITEKELEDICHFDHFSKGKNTALYYLSFKQRSENEVKNYLLKHHVDPLIIPKIIDQLKKENWLNDHNIATLLIEQNLSHGDKGPYVIKQKLQQKGISEKIITRVISDYDFTEVASRIARKLQEKYEAQLPFKALKDKLIQSLINKGFSYQTAKIAVEGLNLSKDDENEEELIYQELDKQYRKYSKRYSGYELKQRLTNALARKGYQFDTIASALRDYL